MQGHRKSALLGLCAATSLLLAACSSNPTHVKPRCPTFYDEPLPWVSLGRVWDAYAALNESEGAADPELAGDVEYRELERYVTLLFGRVDARDAHIAATCQ